MDFTNYKIAFGAVIGFGLGVFLMSAIHVHIYTNKNYKIIKRAIELHAGQYNSKTAEFEWIDKDIRYIVTGEK